jgi:hypothetical protein
MRIMVNLKKAFSRKLASYEILRKEWWKIEIMWQSTLDGNREKCTNKVILPWNVHVVWVKKGNEGTETFRTQSCIRNCDNESTTHKHEIQCRLYRQFSSKTADITPLFPNRRRSRIGTWAWSGHQLTRFASFIAIPRESSPEAFSSLEISRVDCDTGIENRSNFFGTASSIQCQ